MKKRHYLGDAMASVSTNIIFNIVGMMTYFYTDICGLATASVGTILLVSKLADSFSDVAMGRVVDSTKSKYGAARPWLLWMAAPTFVCLVLLFTVPSFAGPRLKTAYALVTNILMLSVVYTAISVPYSSLMTLETNDPHERAKMGIWRLVAAYAAGASVSILLVPAANALGGGQRAWIAMGCVYGAVAAASVLVTFFSVRERHTAAARSDGKKTPLRQGLALLFKNKYWVILLAVNVLINLVFALANGSVVYYAKYIFGDENLVALIGLVDLPFVALGFVMSGAVMKRAGKRNAVLLGMGIAIAACALRALNPYHFWYNVITKSLATMGGIPVLAVIWAMVADSIEYGEWKTGVRTVGLASSVNSFGAKLGSALWAGSVVWLLAFAGYDGALAVQGPMANRMIIALNIYIPLACYAAIFVLMLFYRLDEDYGRITQELEKRRDSQIIT